MRSWREIPTQRPTASRATRRHSPIRWVSWIRIPQMSVETGGQHCSHILRSLQVYTCPDAVPRSTVGDNSYYYEAKGPGAGNASYLLNGIVSTKAIAKIPAPADIVFTQEALQFTSVSQVRPCPVSATLPLTYFQFNHKYYDKAAHERRESALLRRAREVDEEDEYDVRDVRREHQRAGESQPDVLRYRCRRDGRQCAAV